MCTSNLGGFTSADFNLGEKVIGKNQFRAVDPLMGQAERTAATWWENDATNQKAPTPLTTQETNSADTNAVLRQRKIAVNSGAFSSLLPAGPSVSGGTSLLGS